MTYTEAESNAHYDFNTVGDSILTIYGTKTVEGGWVDGSASTGDIAPWKFNAGINIPLDFGLNLNFRGQYITERELYLRNPLRNKGRKAEAYTLIHANIRWKMSDNFSLALKVKNLFDEQYLTPGTGKADGGDEFTDSNGNAKRSIGYSNSLIPHPDRNWMLTLNVTY